MLPFFTGWDINLFSQHRYGVDVAGAVKLARRHVRELVGAQLDQEIVFTSGGTESDNAALVSALETQDGRDEIVTSSVEHPAVLALCHRLESRGVKIHRIGVDERGRLDIDAYRRAVGPKTALVSIMWANNETGTLFPVEPLAALAHEAGALFHADGVQAAGKIPLNVNQTSVDLLSLSAHKLHGPKGIGALYVRDGVAFRPLLCGGAARSGAGAPVPRTSPRSWGLAKPPNWRSTHWRNGQRRCKCCATA